MTAEIIVGWVLRALTLIGYIVLAVLAIKRKKVIIESNNNDEELSKLNTVIGKVISAIKTAESTYKTIFKDGVKAGPFKLKDVLEVAKESCEAEGMAYCKEYWTDFINKEVSLMNFNSESLVHSAVQSTEQKTEFNFIKGA